MSEQSPGHPGGQPEKPTHTEPGDSPGPAPSAAVEPPTAEPPAAEPPTAVEPAAVDSPTAVEPPTAEATVAAEPTAVGHANQPQSDDADLATPRHGFPQQSPQQSPYQGPQQSPYQGPQPGYQHGPAGPGQFPQAAPLANMPHYQAQQGQGQPRGRRRGQFVTVLIALLAGLVGGVIGGGFLTRTTPIYSGAPNALDTPAPTAAPHAPLPPGSVEQVAQKLLPSVVQLQFTGPSGSGEGSGVVLSADGMILTNNHVVEAGAQGARLSAEFQDGRKTPVRIIGRAPDADLAVVQAQGITGLTPAELGNSGGLVVGQQVVAIGSPFQLTGTVTSGIVSALNRPARVGGESGNQSTVLDTVQTDAAINPGNSGGPLVDMQGKVVAINSAIYSPNQGGLGSQQQGGSVGVGFAIPIDQARRIADELRTSGKATVAVLNVAVSPNGAAQIVQVVPGGPGDKAGVKMGDVVVQVGDRRIETGDGLIAAVRSHAPGETVKLTLTDSSGANTHTVEATLGSQDIGTTR